ncbi:unnamed protein product [Phytophthora fragariaefolia]|uniref:Unnamed protein product n=1 Tax=Phytophthora fragariaefolia TaxID=1490495 RepID=A0A9W6XSE5_9STRA|nr:unnamed protein product [Phytophthora fragariaefolia]
MQKLDVELSGAEPDDDQVSRVDGVKLSPVRGWTVDVSRVATLKEVVLTTSDRPLILRNLTCYVNEENLSLDLTLGRPIMKTLGYSTDKLLVDARSNKPKWEPGGSTLEKEGRAVATVPAAGGGGGVGRHSGQ